MRKSKRFESGSECNERTGATVVQIALGPLVGRAIIVQRNRGSRLPFRIHTTEIPTLSRGEFVTSRDGGHRLQATLVVFAKVDVNAGVLISGLVGISGAETVPLDEYDDEKNDEESER